MRTPVDAGAVAAGLVLFVAGTLGIVLRLWTGRVEHDLAAIIGTIFAGLGLSLIIGSGLVTWLRWQGLRAWRWLRRERRPRLPPARVILRRRS